MSAVVCPSWCSADHSSYDEAARTRGDLIQHLGDTTGMGGFTIQIGGEPEPFTVRRYQLAGADGKVHDEGYYFGQHVMTRLEAIDLLERMQEFFSTHTHPDPAALDALAMVAADRNVPFDRSACTTVAAATEAAMGIFSAASDSARN